MKWVDIEKTDTQTGETKPVIRCVVERDDSPASIQGDDSLIREHLEDGLIDRTTGTAYTLKDGLAFLKALSLEFRDPRTGRATSIHEGDPPALAA